MEGGLRPPDALRVWAALATALRLYRLLFLRAVMVAAIVQAVIALLQLVEHSSSGSARVVLGLLVAVAGFAAAPFVQGALIEIVRNIHEGRRPEGMGELFRRSGKRFWSLFLASLLYGIGIAFGLLLLIIPGLLVASRWSLLAPLVMLEHQDVWASRRRSSNLVGDFTGRVLVLVAATYIISLLVPAVLYYAEVSFGTEVFVGFLWSTFTLPYIAHVLTVIYYRLADPHEPVIAPQVLEWRSVWEGR